MVGVESGQVGAKSAPGNDQQLLTGKALRRPKSRK